MKLIKGQSTKGSTADHRPVNQRSACQILIKVTCNPSLREYYAEIGSMGAEKNEEKI